MSYYALIFLYSIPIVSGTGNMYEDEIQIRWVGYSGLAEMLAGIRLIG